MYSPQVFKPDNTRTLQLVFQTAQALTNTTSTMPIAAKKLNKRKIEILTENWISNLIIIVIMYISKINLYV